MVLARRAAQGVGAAAGVLLVVAAAFSTLSTKRATPAELLVGHGQLFESVNDFDLGRPSWHSFDYSRPDFDNALDLNLLGGKTGFFKQNGARGTSLHGMPIGARGVAPVAAMVVPEELPQFVLAGKPVDERDSLSNEERSEAARCNGMLHACTNWMALETGKMRLMIYEMGSWCTDDDLEGSECYENENSIAEDHVFDIPEEGEEMPQELWDAITKSCPVIEGCPKPKAFSTNSDGSAYAAVPAQLATPVTQYLSTLSMARAQCCVQKQQALLQSRTRASPEVAFS